MCTNTSDINERDYRKIRDYLLTQKTALRLFHIFVSFPISGYAFRNVIKCTEKYELTNIQCHKKTTLF